MAPHRIECEKCGAPGTPEKAECAKCRGRVVRVCGECKFKVSLAKRFCDTCGARLDGVAQKSVDVSNVPRPAKGPENFVFESLAESAANELEDHERNKAGSPAPQARAPKPSEPEPPPPPPPQRESRAEPLFRIPTLPPRPGPAHPGAPLEAPPPDESSRRPETARPERRAPEPPPPPPPPPPKKEPREAEKGFNQVSGFQLEPQAPAAPPPPKRDLGLPHTVVGRVVRPPSESGKPPAGTSRPGRESERKAPPPSEETKTPALARPAQRPPQEAPAPPPPPPPRQAPPPPAPAKPKPKSPPPDQGAPKAPPLTRAAQRVASGLAAKLSTAAALALLVTGVAVWAARHKRLGRPEVQVPITARRYLTALKASEFSAAYEMLTEASRRACALDEFEKARGSADWDFSDVAFVAVDRDLAFVRYKLSVEGRQPEEDLLVFKKEGRDWRRPFVWSLLRDVEDAFDRGDPARALERARAALAVNPRDPMSQAYVCEALYYLRDSGRGAEIEKECRAALELSERYPSPLSLNSVNLYHIRAILGDTFKNSLRRYREAAEQYNALLMFPKISPGDQCELLLGRAECALALQDFQGATQDFTRAAGLCEKPADLDYAKRAASVYSGASLKEAIELAQQHPLDEAGQSALEWRRAERAEMTLQWKAQGRGPLPPEDWHAQHLEGPRYRVDVRAGAAVLFSARVDLWTKVVQVETR